MTPEAQKEYIITEEQLLEIGGFADYRDDSSYREMRELQDEIRSRPYKSDAVLDEWQRIAEELWQILDNIDTASDIAKSDDKLYRGLVAQVHKKRFDYADSDGYKLTWKLHTKERE